MSESKACGENDKWSDLEVKAKAVTTCTYEHGKPWGKEVRTFFLDQN